MVAAHRCFPWPDCKGLSLSFNVFLASNYMTTRVALFLTRSKDGIFCTCLIFHAPRTKFEVIAGFAKTAPASLRGYALRQ